MAQSVVGIGLPGKRAGLDALLKRIVVRGNVTGANANTNITVTGIKPGDVVLWVQAGDGTDLGAATVTVTAANTIQIDTSTASKKLNVAFIQADVLAGMGHNGTEQDAYFGVLDSLLGAKLRAVCVAGADGALTVTGLAATDIVLAAFVTDATIDLGGSTWAATANTLTPTASVDTTGVHVVVLYLDVSASAGGNGNDWNSNIGLISAEGFAELIRGLRLSQAAGPNGSATVTAGSFASVVAADNVLGVFYSTSATDPLDGAWTAAAGGVAYAGSANLSAGKIGVLWWDKSAAKAA